MCPSREISCGDGRGEPGNPGEVLEKLVVGDHGETDEGAGNKQTFLISKISNHSRFVISLICYHLKRFKQTVALAHVTHPGCFN